MSDFKAKMHQIRFRLRFHPTPRLGSLQCSPDSLAGFNGPTSKGRKGRGREGKGKGRGRERGKVGKEKGRRRGRGICLLLNLGLATSLAVSHIVITCIKLSPSILIVA